MPVEAQGERCRDCGKPIARIQRAYGNHPWYHVEQAEWSHLPWPEEDSPAVPESAPPKRKRSILEAIRNICENSNPTYKTRIAQILALIDMESAARVTDVPGPAPNKDSE